MTIDPNALGERGEALFVASALKPPRGDTLSAFRTTHLGAKWPLFDYLVQVETEGRRPFAFVSVRSTESPRTATGALRVRWTRDEVEAMRTLPAPAYLAGVDLVEGAVFLRSADSLAAGITVLPDTHRIDCDLIPRWRDEIAAAWKDAPTVFSSEFTA